MKFYFHSKSKRLTKSDFKRTAKQIFKKLEVNDKIELGLKITDDREIKKLNQTYRRVNQSTDVLSFPIDTPDKKKSGENLILGDIVISFDQAKKYSRKACLERRRENNRTVEKELIYLFKHGLLHLLGYDHKKNKKDWQRIEDKISEIGN